MPAPLSTEAKALIDRPNFAHLAALMADGSPHSVPVWVGREGDRLLVCTSEGSLKGRNTRRDPRIAVSIVDLHNPYEEVQLRGRVVGRLDGPEPQDDEVELVPGQVDSVFEVHQFSRFIPSHLCSETTKRTAIHVPYYVCRENPDAASPLPDKVRAASCEHAVSSAAVSPVFRTGGS